MLGNLVAEIEGQATGVRVVSVEGGRPVNEASYQGTGTFLGVAATEMSTFTVLPQPDGSIRGHGQGVYMTADGDMITWQGQGIGRMTDSGGLSWRGSNYFGSESPKFAELTKSIGLFEYDVDQTGKISGRVYEWK